MKIFKLKNNIVKVLSLITLTILLTIGCSNLAQLSNSQLDEQSFEIAFNNLHSARLTGNGCPEDSYALIPNYDGSQISILYSQLEAITEGRNIFAETGCRIELPLTVPECSAIASQAPYLH